MVKVQNDVTRKRFKDVINYLVVVYRSFIKVVVVFCPDERRNALVMVQRDEHFRLTVRVEHSLGRSKVAVLVCDLLIKNAIT